MTIGHIDNQNKNSRLYTNLKCTSTHPKDLRPFKIYPKEP